MKKGCGREVIVCAKKFEMLREGSDCVEVDCVKKSFRRAAFYPNIYTI